MRIEVGRFTSEEGGFYDARPDGLFKGVYRDVLAGVRAEHVNGLMLRNTQIVWSEKAEEYHGPALIARKVARFKLQDFEGKAARPGVPDQQLEEIDR